MRALTPHALASMPPGPVQSLPKSACCALLCPGARPCTVDLFMLHHDGLPDRAPSALLDDLVARGQATRIGLRRHAFTQDATLSLVRDPIVRKWMGQIDLLAECIERAHALDPPIT